MGYRTYYADAVDIAEAEKLDKKWVFQQDDPKSDSYFKDHASLIYSTHKQETEKPLSAYAPKDMRWEYEQALKVKRQDPASFAMRIRRALEAICIDQGAPGRNLNGDLKSLSENGIFPALVAEIAEELKIIGAHIKPRISREVTEEQVQVIDDFFHLVVTYVYEAPGRLQEYRKLLLAGTPEIISHDAIN